MVTKQDIKDIAFELFARNGFAETSMEDIANALSLKKQSLYSHFSGKALIFQEIIQEQFVFMMSNIGNKLKELADQPTEILLIGIAKTYLNVFSSRARLLLWKRIILMTGNKEYSELLNGAHQFDQNLSKDLYKIISLNYPGLSPHEFSGFFMSYMILIFGYLEWMLLDSYNDDVFNVIWRNFWDGVKNQLNQIDHG